jgi:hypothetical protein
MQRSRTTSFAQVLDEVERSEGTPGRFGGVPRVPFAAPAGATGLDPALDYDPLQWWDRALDWVAEAQDAGSENGGAGAPSDNVESIAAELDLPGAFTDEDLKRIRRRFMWNNHPDRRPDVPRELANRRVAIANMLIDHAQRSALRQR